MDHPTTLDELSLDEIEWDVFLHVIKILDLKGVVSIPYLHLRYYVNQKTTDRITASLLRLGWAFFSKGKLFISDKGKQYFSEIKQIDSKELENVS